MYAQLWCEHVKVQHAVKTYYECWSQDIFSRIQNLLQKSGLVFVLHVGSKLDLGLNACKLTGFIKGDGLGSIQYIIPSLKETWREREGGGEKVRGRTHTSRKRIELQRHEHYPKFTLQSSVMSTSLCALNALWLQRGCLLSEWLSVFLEQGHHHWDSSTQGS